MVRGAILAVLRASFWLCIQGSILVVLGGLYRVQGRDQTQVDSTCTVLFLVPGKGLGREGHASAWKAKQRSSMLDPERTRFSQLPQKVDRVNKVTQGKENADPVIGKAVVPTPETPEARTHTAGVHSGHSSDSPSLGCRIVVGSSHSSHSGAPPPATIKQLLKLSEASAQCPYASLGRPPTRSLPTHTMKVTLLSGFASSHHLAQPSPISHTYPTFAGNTAHLSKGGH